MQNGFVNWDDLGNLIDNPSYRGLGWTELRWMFTTLHLSNYRPLTWVTLGFDYLVWGMNPFGYHLTSLLLHAANGATFYFVALRLLDLALFDSKLRERSPLQIAAVFSALVFAVHPLRVESVAWASARNDLLSGLFYLWALLLYLRAATAPAGDGRRTRRMALAVAVYGCSLLSKGIGLTLPIVLLALDIYPLKRLGGGPGKWFGPASRRVWLEKAPFAILAAGAGVVALAAKGTVLSLAEHGLGPRLAAASYGLIFYLRKTVLPLDLAAFIPLPLNPSDWPFVLSGFAALALTAGFFVARRRWPAGLASWVCYALILAPVAGIVQFGEQLVADRYSYLACLPYAVLAGAGLLYARRFYAKTQEGRSGVMFAAALIVVALGALSWRQTQVWRDTETLWRHALTITPESNRAHYGLGFGLHAKGELDEAIQHYRKAIQFGSGFDGHNNLAIALAMRGELEEAIREHRKALELDPANAKGYHDLANAFVAQGAIDDAIRNYREALKLNPAYLEAHNNLGGVLAAQGELAAAIQEYRKVLEIDPAYASGYYNLANALVADGAIEEAIRNYREALKLNPAYAEAHNNLGGVLAGRGDMETAIRHFREALRLSPGHVTHYNLADALMRRGELEQAIVHYRQALAFRPEFAEARQALDQALARQGRRDETTQR